MDDNTQQSQRGSVNRTEASEKPSTQSQKLVNTPPSTTSSSGKLLNPITKENENAMLAAGILASTVPTLVKAGYVRVARNQQGEIVLIFPSTVWTANLRLKE